MVLDQKLGEIALDLLGIHGGQAVDLLDVAANCHDGLPAGDWNDADNWVEGKELITDVLWGAELAGVDLEAALGGGGLGVGGAQVLKEHLVWSGESVKELVVGGEEGVATSLCELGHSQDG